MGIGWRISSGRRVREPDGRLVLGRRNVSLLQPRGACVRDGPVPVGVGHECAVPAGGYFREWSGWFLLGDGHGRQRAGPGGALLLGGSGGSGARPGSTSSRPSLSANPTDGSCWMAESGRMVHLSSTGTELWSSTTGIYAPLGVSVNPTDNSCWVSDWGDSRVVDLSRDRTQLWASANSDFSGPKSVSVNPTDGSCWVADWFHGQVVHLSSTGTELWRSAATSFTPGSVSVNPTDGSCWAAFGSPNQTCITPRAGAELWQSASDEFGELKSVSANPTDGSCWVADAGVWDPYTGTYSGRARWCILPQTGRNCGDRRAASTTSPYPFP